MTEGRPRPCTGGTLIQLGPLKPQSIAPVRLVTWRVSVNRKEAVRNRWLSKRRTKERPVELMARTRIVRTDPRAVSGRSSGRLCSRRRQRCIWAPGARSCRRRHRGAPGASPPSRGGSPRASVILSGACWSRHRPQSSILDLISDRRHCLQVSRDRAQFRLRRRDKTGATTRAVNDPGGNQRPHRILLQQVDRYGKENHVLHQERHVASHRRKSAGGRSPPIRHERNDGHGRDERRAGARRAECAEGFVPEADEDECAEQPLRYSEEPTSTPDAEYGVHPGDERTVADERNQCPSLVVPPLLIPEEEKYDHHRCPKQMVIEVPLQEARFAQQHR